jgi:hypothetical protein
MDRGRLVVVTAALVLAIACGCRRTPVEVPTDLDPEKARLRLEREGARRTRISSLTKARMDGIQGLFASAKLDVALETPGRLHIAVRSFFEQPMQVFATDGVTMTVFDSTHPEGPRFYRGPVTGDALSGLFPVEVWPQDVVALFLQIAPAAGAQARELAVEPKKGSYQVGLLEPSGHVSVVDARLDDDALLRWRRYSGDGALLFDATYEDIRPVADVPLAHRIRLLVPSEDQEARVVFELREPVLNGPELDPALFELQAPPGFATYPLH